jgi:hypothetical protein
MIQQRIAPGFLKTQNRLHKADQPLLGNLNLAKPGRLNLHAVSFILMSIGSGTPASKLNPDIIHRV